MTACLKQLGMCSSSGTDSVRHKQAMSQNVVADLTEDQGIELLMQWLPNPYVVGIFLAPPCGSASRARSIPLKRKSPGDPPAPRPLRGNAFPNGLRFLSFVDKMKISKANKLYHLTAKSGGQWPKESFFVWIILILSSACFGKQLSCRMSCTSCNSRPFKHPGMEVRGQNEPCWRTRLKSLQQSMRCVKVRQQLIAMTNGA